MSVAACDRRTTAVMDVPGHPATWTSLGSTTLTELMMCWAAQDSGDSCVLAALNSRRTQPGRALARHRSRFT